MNKHTRTHAHTHTHTHTHSVHTVCVCARACGQELGQHTHRGSHARGEAGSTLAALELRDLLLQRVHRGVGRARVRKPFREVLIDGRLNERRRLRGGGASGWGHTDKARRQARRIDNNFPCRQRSVQCTAEGPCTIRCATDSSHVHSRFLILQQGMRHAACARTW